MKPLTNETIILAHLWKGDPGLKHVPIYIPSRDFRVNVDHYLMEYLPTSLAEYFTSHPEDLISLTLQMLGALKEVH